MTATVIELADDKLREINAKKSERRLEEVNAIVRRFKATFPSYDKSVDEIPRLQR